MFSENWKKEWISIPNGLSIFRIILIPVYISVYLGAESDLEHLGAAAILVVSYLTDLADGLIARRYHMVTNVGKLLDPLADKLTQLSLMLSLSAKHTFLFPILMLFLMKELFQVGALLYFSKKGKVLPGALWAGKICTTVLFVSFLLLVIFPGIHFFAILLIIAVDTFFLLYSFISYIIAYFINENSLVDFTS